MSILCSAYNIYQIFISTFKHNILKIRNENETHVVRNNIQYMEHSQATEPCRSCTDFQTFSRMKRQEFSQTQVHNYFTTIILNVI